MNPTIEKTDSVSENKAEGKRDGQFQGDYTRKIDPLAANGLVHWKGKFNCEKKL
jgi:hypothetical protein